VITEAFGQQHSFNPLQHGGRTAAAAVASLGRARCNHLYNTAKAAMNRKAIPYSKILDSLTKSTK
jgi:hypothetical protein